MGPFVSTQCLRLCCMLDARRKISNVLGGRWLGKYKRLLVARCDLAKLTFQSIFIGRKSDMIKR